jgi:beta-fructofuranosidase
MLRLEDHWVWDSWHVQEDDGRRHVFFLRASRALLDPDRRHQRASIGHAVSADLRSWRLVADALVPADAPGWDDLATWTGSVVPGPDGRWYLFYTGVSRADQGLVQRIGLATSDDLLVWRRWTTGPLLEADPRWYETLDRTQWYEQAWRDPWVFADPGGDGWHMLITARSNAGPAHGRGVIGHARSSNLVQWTVEPPLGASAGFGHLEVPQVAVVDGQPLLLFCTNAIGPERATADRIWCVPGPDITGPWDLASARAFPHPNLYAPRLVTDIDGTPALIGFLDQVDGGFVGELTDPIRVRYDASAGLVAEPPPVASSLGLSAAPGGRVGVAQ